MSSEATSRLASVGREIARRWGTMSSQEMLCHMSDAFEPVLGARPPRIPIVGALSAREWLRWGYRHTDHRLRQFGAADDTTLNRRVTDGRAGPQP